MQRVFSFIGIVVAGSLVMAISKDLINLWGPISITQANPVNPTARSDLIRSMRRVQATLPRRVDDSTTLVAVGLDGMTYWQRAVVDVDAAEFTPAIKKNIRTGIISEVCNQKSLRAWIAYGGTFESRYYDRSERFIMTVDVVKNDCR